MPALVTRMVIVRGSAAPTGSPAATAVNVTLWSPTLEVAGVHVYFAPAGFPSWAVNVPPGICGGPNLDTNGGASGRLGSEQDRQLGVGRHAEHRVACRRRRRPFDDRGLLRPLGPGLSEPPAEATRGDEDARRRVSERKISQNVKPGREIRVPHCSHLSANRLVNRYRRPERHQARQSEDRMRSASGYSREKRCPGRIPGWFVP